MTLTWAVALALGFGSGAMAQIPVEGAMDRDMVFIPAGECAVGTSDEEIKALAAEYHVHPSLFVGESPRRTVQVEAFLIDRYPVTNEQYREFVQATGHAPPLNWPGGAYPEGQDDYPVTGLPWSYANGYAQWAGKRLPTAEEWEKAARGTDGRTYPWGNEWDDRACRTDDPACPQALPRTAPVGAFPAGASPYGVMDMCGNVAQWTATPAAPEDPVHNWRWYVVKGAGGAHRLRYNFRCAARAFSAHESRWHNWLGFRCAMDAHTDPGNLAPPRPTPSLPPTPTAPGPDASALGTRPIKVTPSDVESHAWAHVRPPYLPGVAFGIFVPEQLGTLDLPLAWGLPHEPFRWDSDDGTRATYRCVWPGKAALTAALEGASDVVTLTFTLTNLGDKPLTGCRSNVCLNVHGAPYFDDPERIRTMVWTDEGPVSVNLLPADGPGEPMHTGWALAPPGNPANAADGAVRYPLICTVSRDGRWTIAQAYREAIDVSSNAHYSCLHTRPVWPDVPPGEERIVVGKLYFIKGGPQELLARWRKDFALE